jgi:glucan phosphoethanolaminetransferase (alkaline phosphatase superfamily)
LNINSFFWQLVIVAIAFVSLLVVASGIAFGFAYGAMVSLAQGMVYVVADAWQKRHPEWHGRTSLRMMVRIAGARMLLVILLMAAAFLVFKFTGGAVIAGFITGQLGFLADRLAGRQVNGK